jgi:malate synthase
MSKMNVPAGVTLMAPVPAPVADILSLSALEFLAKLQRYALPRGNVWAETRWLTHRGTSRAFNARRIELLQARVKRQHDLDAGVIPSFLEETRWVREDPTWMVRGLIASPQLRQGFMSDANASYMPH